MELGNIAILLADPAVWASFLTLTVLEIVLGVDNIVFISIVAGRLPAQRRESARNLALTLAILMRVALLFAIAWLASLSSVVLDFTILGHDFAFSWRDIILLGGGLFLIYKAATEIHGEVEGEEVVVSRPTARAVSYASVMAQLLVINAVFSIDSILTAVGIAQHIEVMIAAVVVSGVVMLIAAGPLADFVHRHPSTKMLALAFLVMIGVSLIAESVQFHFERSIIYGAMVFAGFVEALNLMRAKRLRRRPADGPGSGPGVLGQEPRKMEETT